MFSLLLCSAFAIALASSDSSDSSNETPAGIDVPIIKYGRDMYFWNKKLTGTFGDLVAHCAAITNDPEDAAEGAVWSACNTRELMSVNWFLKRTGASVLNGQFINGEAVQIPTLSLLAAIVEFVEGNVASIDVDLLTGGISTGDDEVIREAEFDAYCCLSKLDEDINRDLISILLDSNIGENLIQPIIELVRLFREIGFPPGLPIPDFGGGFGVAETAGAQATGNVANTRDMTQFCSALPETFPFGVKKACNRIFGTTSSK